MRRTSAFAGSLLTALAAASFFMTASATTTITPLPPIQDPMTHGCSGGVTVTGDGPLPLTGTVFFSVDRPYPEGGYFAGGQVVNGLVEFKGFACYPGSSVITAAYSGDLQNRPASVTFRIFAPVIGWLPAVLNLLSD